MTTTSKTTVTHPDSTVTARKSKTRAYTHAIEIAPAAAADYAAALIARAEKDEARAATYLAAADAASVTIAGRGFAPTAGSMNDFQATLRGTDRTIYTWCSADAMTESNGTTVAVADYLVDYARAYAADITAAAATVRAEAAAVLAAGTPVGKYGVLRWSSRADLAVKALSEFDHYVGRGHSLRVVAVDEI